MPLSARSDRLIVASQTLHGQQARAAQQTDCRCARARTREMFDLLDQKINESGYREIISSGIVLTGGASSMQGMAELAEDVFQSPVRVGTPFDLGGLINVASNPMYATCTGLIQYGFKRRKMGPARELQGRNLFDKIFSRMKDWADEFF